MASTAGELLDDAAARLRGRGVGSSDLDAELLLGHTMGLSRAALLARRGDVVAADARARFASLLARREERVPIAYLLGEKEFWSLPFEVNEHVLIPRPDTEIAVAEALRIVKQELAGAPPPVIADVGTGAGPIAVSLAREMDSAAIHATDISPEALEVARRNAARHGVAQRIKFHLGDLLQPLFDAGLEGGLDMIVSNPPYVGHSENVSDEVIRWEPRVAVYSGETGAEVYVRLVPQAARALAPGGRLVMEITPGKEAFVRGLLVGGGASLWTDVSVRDDLAGLPRVVTARRTRPRKK